MPKYLIRLKPLTPFFFGGENTFGNDNRNYFVKSNYLPQQTTILGMLRYQLLVQNNLLGTNPKENNWKDFIGKDSFQEKEEVFTDSFGKISNISPLFLSNGKKHYISQAMDWAIYKDEATKEKKCGPVNVSFENDGSSKIEEFQNVIPFATVNGKSFNPKYGLKELWAEAETENPLFIQETAEAINEGKYENRFFIKKDQVGIHKTISKEDDNNKDFYRQVSYLLKEDMSFAFFVESKEAFKNAFVKLGGEAAVFSMEVKKAGTDTFNTIFKEKVFRKNHNRSADAVILLSDAYCKSDILSHCHFAICESVPFRNLTTHTNSEGSFSAMGKDRKIRKTMELKYLLKRGSVLYPKGNIEQFINTYIQNKSFQNIGYNICLEINKNQ